MTCPLPSRPLLYVAPPPARRTGTSLSLEVLLYFDSYYKYIWFIIELFTFIYKGRLLEYPDHRLGLEIVLVCVIFLAEFMRQIVCTWRTHMVHVVMKMVVLYIMILYIELCRLNASLVESRVGCACVWRMGVWPWRRRCVCMCMYVCVCSIPWEPVGSSEIYQLGYHHDSYCGLCPLLPHFLTDVCPPCRRSHQLDQNWLSWRASPLCRAHSALSHFIPLWLNGLQ